MANLKEIMKNSDFKIYMSLYRLELLVKCSYRRLGMFKESLESGESRDFVNETSSKLVSGWLFFYQSPIPDPYI